MELSEEVKAMIEEKAKIEWGNVSRSGVLAFMDGAKYVLTDPELLSKAGWVKKKEWISVNDRLPEEKDADENGNVLIWRETNDGQRSLSKSIYAYKMVKHLAKSSFWQPLPSPPQNK